jgi:hypothetical protein
MHLLQEFGKKKKKKKKPGHDFKKIIIIYIFLANFSIY